MRRTRRRPHGPRAQPFARMAPGRAALPLARRSRPTAAGPDRALPLRTRFVAVQGIRAGRARYHTQERGIGGRTGPVGYFVDDLRKRCGKLRPLLRRTIVILFSPKARHFRLILANPVDHKRISQSFVGVFQFLQCNFKFLYSSAVLR